MALDYIHQFLHWVNLPKPSFHDSFHYSIDPYLIIIPVFVVIIFFFLTLLKSRSQLMDKLIFCSKCASFFIVFILSVLLGSPPAISILLLGMSATGMSYLIHDSLIARGKNYLMQDLFIQLVLAEIAIFISIIILK